MNKDEREQEILLELSGELSARRKRRLERILARSEEGRAFRDETKRLTDLSRAALADEGPAPSVVVRIMDEARKDSHTKPAPITFLPRPVYAVAATLVLGFSLWLVIQRPPPSGTEVAEHEPKTLVEIPAWDDDIDSQLEALDELLLAMDTDTMTIFDASEELDIESLARELLLLEEEEI